MAFDISSVHRILKLFFFREALLGSTIKTKSLFPFLFIVPSTNDLDGNTIQQLIVNC